MQPNKKVEINGAENDEDDGGENEEVESTEAEEAMDPSRSISGDVIGNTAYSERFVLKILIKLANKDTLKDELQDPSFENELCTLWDMTAERDVALYLQGHNVLNLFSFALPIIESARIIEIIIGIVGNMCCHREISEVLIKNKDLMDILADHLKSDDSQILNQLLRLISSCVFLAEEADIDVWMQMFEKVDYPDILYFILKNSTNKDLLVSALENLNTLCAQGTTNGDKYDEFSNMFVKTEALDALYTAYKEVIKQMDHSDDKSRMRVISVQIVLNLLRFDQQVKIFSSNRQTAVRLLRDILTHYEEQIRLLPRDDTVDLIDILEAADIIVNVLKVSETNNPDKYLSPCYKMWKAVLSIPDEHNVIDCYKRLITPLSMLMCTYISQSSDDNLVKALAMIGDDYDSIIGSVKDDKLKANVVDRTAICRNKLIENVNSD